MALKAVSISGSGGGGGGTPGGTSGQVQYNNAGTFGGVTITAGTVAVGNATTGLTNSNIVDTGTGATYSGVALTESSGGITPFDPKVNMPWVEYLFADDIVGNDGDTISTWGPGVGTGPALTPGAQGHAAVGAILRKFSNGQNNKNVLNFNGTTMSYSSTTGSPTSSQDMYMCAVVRPNQQNSFMDVVNIGNFAAVNGARRGVLRYNDNFWGFVGQNNDIKGGSVTKLNQVYFVEISLTAAGVGKLYINGTLIGTLNSGYTSYTNTQINVGTYPTNTTGGDFVGDIALVGISTIIPNSTTQNNFYGWLENYYGFTIANATPVLQYVADYTAPNILGNSIIHDNGSQITVGTNVIGITVGQNAFDTKDNALGRFPAQLTLSGPIYADAGLGEHTFIGGGSNVAMMSFRHTSDYYAGFRCLSSNGDEHGGMAYGGASAGAPFTSCLFIESSDYYNQANAPTPFRIVETGTINGTYAPYLRYEHDALGNINFYKLNSANNIYAMRIMNTGDIEMGTGTTATTDINGYVFVPSVAGTPTGVPALTPTNEVATRYDITNTQSLAYVNSAWTNGLRGNISSTALPTWDVWFAGDVALAGFADAANVNSFATQDANAWTFTINTTTKVQRTTLGNKLNGIPGLHATGQVGGYYTNASAGGANNGANLSYYVGAVIRTGNGGVSNGPVFALGTVGGGNGTWRVNWATQIAVAGAIGNGPYVDNYADSIFSNGIVLAANTAHFVEFSYDATTKITQMFVDGVGAGAGYLTLNNVGSALCTLLGKPDGGVTAGLDLFEMFVKYNAVITTAQQQAVYAYVTSAARFGNTITISNAFSVQALTVATSQGSNYITDLGGNGYSLNKNVVIGGNTPGYSDWQAGNPVTNKLGGAMLSVYGGPIYADSTGYSANGTGASPDHLLISSGPSNVLALWNKSTTGVSAIRVLDYTGKETGAFGHANANSNSWPFGNTTTGGTFIEASNFNSTNYGEFNIVQTGNGHFDLKTRIRYNTPFDWQFLSSSNQGGQSQYLSFAICGNGDLTLGGAQAYTASTDTFSGNALATNATLGFPYLPTCAGLPTGTPSSRTGYSPVVINSISGQLYNYSNSVWSTPPAIIGTDRKTGLTAAQALATYTVGSVDASFMISANVLITASTAFSFTVTCTYTDEGNTSRTLTLNFSQISGTLVQTLTNVLGAGAYEGVPLHIRAKAGTTIIIASATGGTYTTVTYNLEERIQQL